MNDNEFVCVEVTGQPGTQVAVDFGWWPERDGRQGCVRWFEQTRRLVYYGPGTYIELLDELDLTEVRHRLAGWEDAAGTKSVQWVRDRLAPTQCPTCHGEGWVQSTHTDEGDSTVACHCQMPS